MKPRPGIMDIKPYVGGRSQLEGAGRVVKLSSNESPLGPSPRAMAAFKACAEGLHRYPDGGAHDLRQAIADHFALSPDRIVCGAGSDEIISLLCQAYLAPGDEALYSQHGFLMYRLSTLAAGGEPVAAPETDATANVDALLDRVTDRTRLVFLANPNNPTGTYLPAAEVRRLHRALPENVLLVLDAAYAEFVRRNDYEAGIDLVGAADNVVMTRTFSKIYGLAGLRLGWAYCPPGVADVLNRVRGPFNVSTPAQAAGIAALQDVSFTGAAADHNAAWLPQVDAAVRRLGLSATSSVANFVLIHFPDKAGKTAAEADAYLSARGIILRRVEEYGFPNALRMTIGLAEENEAALDALAQFMAEDGS